MLQNEFRKQKNNETIENKSQNETFKKELEQYDKTVNSEMCQVTSDNNTKQQEKTFSKSQQNNFTTNYQNQDLTVTQYYQNEQFEEYNSDEDKDVYKIQMMDQSIKKSSSNRLEGNEQREPELILSMPINNNEHIQILRKKAIAAIGLDLFNKAYQFMNHHLSIGSGYTDIQKNLEDILGKSRMGDCKLIDEILQYENQSK